jgi:hypothetical protein
MAALQRKVNQLFPWICTGMGALILFGPMLITGKSMYWGTIALQFTPWRALGWEQLLSGLAPLWNPYVGMGAPLMANYQTAFFYPPNWILALMAALGGTAGIAWGETLLVMLHVIWAGWGMIHLVKAMGGRPFAQTVSALAFSLSGYMISRSSFLSINSALAWMPWVIAFVYLNAVPEGRGVFKYRLLLVLCMAAQLLAGHAQTTWYTFMLAGGLSLYWGWRNGHWAGAARQGGWFVLSGILAGLIASVQLIPTAEYLMMSQRAGQVDFNYAMNYSFWPWRLLTIVCANLFGSPAQGNYWVTADAYWEDAIYVGLIPFILAVSAFLPREKPVGKTTAMDKGWIVLLGILCSISLLLALGRYTPVFPFLYKFIPTFDMFQAPTRFSVWYVWGVSMLAGIGADQWFKPVGKGLRKSNLPIVIALAILIAAGGAWFILRNNIQTTYITGLAASGLIFLAFSILNKNAPLEKDQIEIKPWHWAAAILILADLVYADYGLNPGLNARLLIKDKQTSPQTTENSPGRIYIPAEAESRLKFKKYFLFDSFLNQKDMQDFSQSILPDENSLYALSMANNFDPLQPARFTKWMDALEKASDPVKMKMLDWMNVTSIEHIGENAPYPVRFDQNDAGRSAYWTNCAVRADSEKDAWNQTQQLLTEKSREKGILQRIVLEESGGDVCPAAASQAVIQQKGQKSDSLEYSVQTPEHGWLMVSQTYYPGWKVRIDGQDGLLIRANYLFSAVEVPAGSHIINIYYDPASYKAGWIISTATIIILLAILLFRQVRRLRMAS